MITKEDIKSLINLILKFDGEATLSHIPKDTINSTLKLYELYYGGWSKISIGKYCRYEGKNSFEVTNENINSVVDDIYKLLKECVGNEIFIALDYLDLEPEELKYMDREKETYTKFKKEVRRIKKENRYER